MKRIVFAVLFVVFSCSYVAAQQAQQEEKGNGFVVKHGFVVKQGQTDSFSQGIKKIIHGGETVIIRLGDETNNIALGIKISGLVYSIPTYVGKTSWRSIPNISVEIENQQQCRVLPETQSHFDKITNPLRYELEDRAAYYSRSAVSLRQHPKYVANYLIKGKVRGTPIWSRLVSQDETLLLKDEENYWALRPIKFVRSEETTKKKEVIWKSVVCEWKYWRPATEQEKQTAAAAQQTQQGEEAQKFAVRQGKGEFDPKIRTEILGTPCFHHTNNFFKVGDGAGVLGLRGSLGALASRKAEMRIAIRGNLQYYLCTPKESALILDFEKLDPTQLEYQDKAKHFKTTPQMIFTLQGWIPKEKQPTEEEMEEEMKKTLWKNEPLWKNVEKDQIIIFKLVDTYIALKPTEFVPMYNSVEEMPKIHRWKGIESYQGPPPIWKSVKYEWARWTPVRNPEDVTTLRTLGGKWFIIGKVRFSWEPRPDPNPELKFLELCYRAMFQNEISFCLLKQSDISSINDPSLLEFREAPLDKNRSGSISVETGDVIVFLLDKYYLAMRPVKVEKGTPFTAVFYERRRWSIAPSVASIKKADPTRSAQ